MWLLNSSGNYGGKVERARKTVSHYSTLSVKNVEDIFLGYHVITNAITLVSPSKAGKRDRKETRSQWHFHNKLWNIIILVPNNSRTLCLSSAQCLKISALVRIIVKNHLWLPFGGSGSGKLLYCKYLYQVCLHKILPLPVLVLGDFLEGNQAF